jgi:tetratricopeptide (TPR) repeat protein
MAEARKALYSGGFEGEWATAVLYMRAADAHLWRPDPQARRKRVKLALAALGAVLGVALLALLIWSQIGPTRMDPSNTMNIALLDPGQPGAARERPRDAALMRGWLAEELQDAIRARPAERVALWHDGLGRSQKRNKLPALTAAEPGEREAEARRVAERIGADVVISARVEGEAGTRRLQPEFYIFSRLAPEAGESIGRYAFGAPILLPPDLAAADALRRDGIAKELAQRAKLLHRLLLALREDALGRHAESLALLEELERDLGLAGLTDEQVVARAGSISGLDTLYYFLGREKLFLGRSDEAEADAWRAAQINGDDPRPWIILGGALLRQSEAVDPATALEPDGLLDRAEQAYGEAVRVSADGSTANAVARLALGNARVARGATLYATGGDDESARAAFEQAAEELTPLLATLELEKQYRMLAQCRSYLGAARLYEGSLAERGGDDEAARGLLEEAQAHFNECVAQGEKLPEDATLRDRIIGGVCEPARQQAAQALLELGGG